MFYGAPVRSLDDIARLRRTGFDFGEIAVTNAGARRMWWESGVINGGTGKFLLSLNIHVLVDRRIVSGLVLPEKIRALKQIVEYGRRNSVAINLENLSETAEE